MLVVPDPEFKVKACAPPIFPLTVIDPPFVEIDLLAPITKSFELEFIPLVKLILSSALPLTAIDPPRTTRGH